MWRRIQRRQVNYEYERMFTEGAVAYFEVLHRQMSGGTKKDDKSLSQKLRDPIEDANRELPD